MPSEQTFPLFQKALAHHLAGISGLKGIHAFLREDGPWQEAARLGKCDIDAAEPVLERFAPDGGGSVAAIGGAEGTGDAAAAWLASYMLGAPGLDLVVLLRLEGLGPTELQGQLAQVEAKVGWLMLAALSDRSDQVEDIALGTEIGAQVLLDAASARSRRQLADQWIARLERALSPDLIAVTWMKAGRPKLLALSGGGLVERNSEARSQVEALADHAVEARTPLLIAAEKTPDPDQLRPEEADLPDPAKQSAAEEALARVAALGGARGVAMPVYEGDEAAAVVVAVWADGSTAGDLHPEAVDLLARVLGETLAIQGRAYPSILRRMGNWCFALLRKVFGLTAWKIKLFFVLLALTVGVLSQWPTRYEPDFSARIEAQDRRVISAPFDGFLSAAPYQLGDVIAPGSLIVAMEDSDLVLQVAQVTSQLEEISSEIQTARAQRDTARVQSLEAQARQVRVQLDLAEQQLQQARFTAEATSAVVGGDAWRRVGGRVRLGEALLELAATDRFRLLVFVDEDWIADLSPGDQGTLLLTAYPAMPIAVTLDSITTDPQLRDGRNTFAAWMRLDQLPDVTLLDGMRGVVRVDAGETTMLQAYLRGSLRWLRRSLWRWGL